jgi:hypothetical protein
MSFFDELGDDRPDKVNVKPFHMAKDEGDEAVFKWCTKVIETLEKQAVARNSKMRKNLETYRGATSTIKRTDIRRSDRQFLNKVNKFIVNHLHRS